MAFLNSFSNNRLSKLTFDRIVLKYSSMSIIVKSLTYDLILAFGYTLLYCMDGRVKIGCGYENNEDFFLKLCADTDMCG